MWRFVQLSDPHLASQRDGEWNNRFLCSMMPEVMACLRHDLRQFEPDFIFLTGDICSKQTRAAVFQAREFVESLGIRYYPMGGNHDFVLDESRQWFLDAFAHCLPARETFYSFTHKGIHFCVLDPWWKWADGTLDPASEASVAAEIEFSLDRARWVLPPHQFVWLEQDLEEHYGEPTILGMHYPALPIPHRMRRPGYRDSGALDNGRLLLEMLANYPQVKAVFSGHMHMNYIERTRSVVQVVTSALPEFPVEYRLIDVHDDHLVIHTCPLSDPQFARRSLIPGHEWTQGSTRDREAVIALG